MGDRFNIPDRKDRLPVQENPILVGRKKLARIAKEETEAGHEHFTDAFTPEDPRELPDSDVQDFLDFENGNFDISNVAGRRMDINISFTLSQKELMAYMVNKSQIDMDRRK